MKKRILILFSMMTLCVLLFTSCSGDKLGLNKAYVCDMQEYYKTGYDLDRGEVIYNRPSNMYEFEDFKKKRKEGMADKVLTLNGEDIILKYSETDNMKTYCSHVFDEYVNDEYRIRSYYYSDSDRLNYLDLGNYVYKISDVPITNEKQLLDTCRSFLLSYVDNLDKYDISVESLVQKNTEHGLQNKRLDYYTNESEGEITYYVNYTFAIDNIVTMDALKIIVKNDGSLDSVSINMVGEYDKYTDYDIDIEKCDGLVEKEILRMCDVKGYDFLGYDVKKLLVLTENKMCVLYFIDPMYEGVSHTYQITVVVPVAQ